MSMTIFNSYVSLPEGSLFLNGFAGSEATYEDWSMKGHETRTSHSDLDVIYDGSVCKHMDIWFKPQPALA